MIVCLSIVFFDRLKTVSLKTSDTKKNFSPKKQLSRRWRNSSQFLWSKTVKKLFQFLNRKRSKTTRMHRRLFVCYVFGFSNEQAKKQMFPKNCYADVHWVCHSQVVKHSHNESILSVCSVSLCRFIKHMIIQFFRSFFFWSSSFFLSWVCPVCMRWFLVSLAC